MNLYEILGVEKNADLATIEKAYQELIENEDVDFDNRLAIADAYSALVNSSQILPTPQVIKQQPKPVQNQENGLAKFLIYFTAFFFVGTTIVPLLFALMGPLMR